MDTAAVHSGDGGIRLMPPDIRLVLDRSGTIREVATAETMPTRDLDGWIGKRWDSTVDPAGKRTIASVIKRAVTGEPAVSCEISQRFPDGRELPIEYTTVSADDGRILVAIGKNLQTVRELEAKLLEAQQRSANSHIKLRETETRYQSLLEASHDAVVLLDSTGARIVEANVVALRALGLDKRWRESKHDLTIESILAKPDFDALMSMLELVREANTAPGLLVHLRNGSSPWFARAALTRSGDKTAFLLRLSPAETGLNGPHPEQPVSRDRIDIDLASLAARWPHPFIVTDEAGRIEFANDAFLDIVQLGSISMVIGQNLNRWLSRPGASFRTLLATLGTRQAVRSAPTVLHSELGLDTEVELSAAPIGATADRRFGVMLVDVSRRIVERPDDVQNLLALMHGSIGHRNLRQVTRDAVTMIEREYIRSALAATDNNRTATAEALGLSRQGLYAKLSRYGLLEETPARAEEEGE